MLDLFSGEGVGPERSLPAVGSAQIGKVTQDLWLTLCKNLGEITDANLLFAHQVEQTEASLVALILKRGSISIG
jgi:hypothetical protein